MTDRFVPMPLVALWKRTLTYLDAGHYFGIPAEVFYRPGDSDLETLRFGRPLATPLGPAAGPHTQLSQNIVGAWLCGARYMELKTVQTLDELEVTKPCIDMQEEGYNCEWSQELRIRQSFDQYLDAWIIIHLLSHRLGWKDAARKTIFNMSVGYNLEGILQPNVQWFFEKMADCSQELEAKIAELSVHYPEAREVNIPSLISDNITLSTMHGCPPQETEKIGMYLIKERGLHTVIKLNPTLLGPEKVREILNHKMGFPTPVPDQAFEHDLKYPDAVRIITNLQQAADEKGVTFGLKLTNTLESNNFRKVFPKEQQQMYMSGKALHPLAVNLAAQVRGDFPDLNISFSAGADCFNIAELLACNLSPVTVSSDLLKPGGYGRLSQYLCHLQERLHSKGMKNIPELMQENPEEKLRAYSNDVLNNPAYHKGFREQSIKTLRPLNPFDCIHAPCMSTCPSTQDIPLYMHYSAQGNWQKAFEVIMQTNPFPTITGSVCDHECQGKCTRINYDSTLAIREIKRYVAAKEHDEAFIQSLPDNGLKAAIIGAGPAGLSCAWYLRLAGFEVDVYEQKSAAGGMVQQVIPDFRMTRAEVGSDISRMESLGVKIHYNRKISSNEFEKLHASGVYIFVGIGALGSRKLNIPGEEADGVKEPLKFLSDFKNNPGQQLDARNILVIGGGNTAMDVAHTAKRFAGKNSRVRIVYRRTMQDMPASREEIFGAKDEGVEMLELLAPERIIVENGRVKGLQCYEMVTDGIDDSGRKKVKPVKDKIIALEADMIIPAVGQLTQWEFASAEDMIPGEDGFSTRLERVFIGGDARAGASNIISAIADGRKVAEAITRLAGKRESTPDLLHMQKGKAPVKELLVKKATRVLSTAAPDPVTGQQPRLQNDNQARQEAERCLLCDEICNICVTVCPNFANQGYEVEPISFALQKALQDGEGNVSLEEDETFTITQKHQIYNLADFCNECGNCNTFCPTMGAPYQDKPKIHLSDESWDSATEGFRIIPNGQHSAILQKVNPNTIYQLEESSKGLMFTTPDFSTILNAQTLRIENIRFSAPHIREASMQAAAVMFILLKGLKQKDTL